jgi:hypothetical protein
VHIGRKAFLKTLAALAASGSGFRQLSGVPVFAASVPTPISGCGAAAFAAQLHTRFRVTDSAGNRAVVKLTDVHECACDPSLEQFSLAFASAEGPTLQGICRFDHAALGANTFFITSRADDAQRSIYHVSFNRLRETRLEA